MDKVHGPCVWWPSFIVSKAKRLLSRNHIKMACFSSLKPTDLNNLHGTFAKVIFVLSHNQASQPMQCHSTVLLRNFGIRSWVGFRIQPSSQTIPSASEERKMGESFLNNGISHCNCCCCWYRYWLSVLTSFRTGVRAAWNLEPTPDLKLSKCIPLFLTSRNSAATNKGTISVHFQLRYNETRVPFGYGNALALDTLKERIGQWRR